MRYGLLLAGGHGERFWPKSRLREPKQFLRLEGNKSLLQVTAERLSGWIPRKNLYVVALASQAGRIRKEMRYLKASQVIGEPVGKNTAAAVALGCSRILRKDPEAVIAVFPCDQWIGDRRSFLGCLKEALRRAGKGRSIVIFGVKPTRPDTGYGYIKTGRRGAVRRFIEKPNLAKAKRLLASRSVLWNSGMFVFKGSLLLEALRAVQPRLLRAFFTEPKGSLKRRYASLPAVSFDTAVLERFPKIECITARFPWEDVGSWLSVARRTAPDRLGNRVIGEAFAVDSKENLVVSEERHLVGLFGLSDVAVIHTTEATLVCPKERLGRLREFLNRLKRERGLRSYL